MNEHSGIVKAIKILCTDTHTLGYYNNVDKVTSFLSQFKGIGWVFSNEPTYSDYLEILRWIDEAPANEVRFIQSIHIYDGAIRRNTESLFTVKIYENE
jgi:hypothetical protein